MFPGARRAETFGGRLFRPGKLSRMELKFSNSPHELPLTITQLRQRRSQAAVTVPIVASQPLSASPSQRPTMASSGVNVSPLFLPHSHLSSPFPLPTLNQPQNLTPLPPLQVLRYSALLAGALYGFSHQASLTTQSKAHHLEAEHSRQESLIRQAKAEWAKKTAPRESSGAGTGMFAVSLSCWRSRRRRCDWAVGGGLG